MSARPPGEGDTGTWDGYAPHPDMTPALESIVRSVLSHVRAADQGLCVDCRREGGPGYGLSLAEGNLRWLVGERV